MIEIGTGHAPVKTSRERNQTQGCVNTITIVQGVC